MSLIGLALAAAVNAAPAPEPPAAEPTGPRPSRPGCAPILQQVRDRQRETFRQLGRLPPGALQYAVLRDIGGCGVPTPMGYHPDYLLPGAADAPLRREDAPSNRR